MPCFSSGDELDIWLFADAEMNVKLEGNTLVSFLSAITLRCRSIGRTPYQSMILIMKTFLIAVLLV